MRSAPGTPSPSTNSENVMVATPLGPNQAMKPLVAVSSAGAGQRDPDRHRPRHQQRDDDERDRRPAVAEQPVGGQQRAEHDEDPELDDLDDVVGAVLEAHAQVGAQDPERDRADEHGDEAVALGGSPTAMP